MQEYLRRTNLRHSFPVRLVGSRNCFLFHSLFYGIIIEKELHVLQHKVRLSLSLFALLSRRGGGDEEEEEQQREGKESFSFSKRKDSFVIYNFRNARDLSFESSHAGARELALRRLS